MNYFKRNFGEILAIVLIFASVYLIGILFDNYLPDNSEGETGSYCFPAGNWDC